MSKPFEQTRLVSENKIFSDIMSNNKSYEVPAFQRDYSWKQEQIDELWEDYENMSKNRTQHFMGYLVLQTVDGETFTIIDGQQRLTTITLMIIAALHRFQQLINDNISIEDNKKRVEHYHETHLGVFNPTTLKTSLKLTLNKNNKSHWEKMAIMNSYEVPRLRDINASNKKLNDALKSFQEKMRGYGDDELINFINNVDKGFLFTTVTVQDESDAYMLFETLNARGVHLAAPDLLKNYLFSLMAKGEGSDDDLEDLNNGWLEVLGQLGVTNFTSFLRSYQGMFDPLIDKQSLYRKLKSKVTSPDDVYPYLQGIRRYAPIYAVLQNPDDDFWKEFDNKVVNNLRTLDTFNIKMPLSLLMAVFENFSAKDFAKVLQWIVVVSIRYNVICGKNSKEQERRYNDMVNKITKEKKLHNNDGKIIADAKKSLSSIYPSDEEFESAFSRKSMLSKHRKRILHLLSEIETHCNKSPSPDLTLEHVLPLSPENHWQESFGFATYQEARERLGNIALLPESDQLGQETFEEKREVLKKSNLAINKKIAAYDIWDIESLNKYQQWLAKQATAVWRIT